MFLLQLSCAVSPASSPPSAPSVRFWDRHIWRSAPMSSDLCIHQYGLPRPPSHIFIHRIYLFPQLWITHCPLNVPLFSCWFPGPFNPVLCPSIFYPFFGMKQISWSLQRHSFSSVNQFYPYCIYHVCTFLCASRILFHLTLWKRHTRNQKYKPVNQVEKMWEFQLWVPAQVLGCRRAFQKSHPGAWTLTSPLN